MAAPEILAPAGGASQLAAAVRCGATAVYFGTPAFNARRNAENFSEDAFLAAVWGCHVRGVKVYVTLNTLVKDAEMPALRETVRLIAQSGADAVIVQDPGVAAQVKRLCPSLPLHASTQMAVHNLAGVKQLEALGFVRVVLARELSLEEIRSICKSTPLQTEVFVHGAHCMSVSGLCYMSSVFGGRSGNRGLCAQPCRLDFSADGREYALSLKDMSLLSHLRALADAGVSSFKIEGRMKRPEYVAAAVTAAVNAAAGQPVDTDALQRVFSRSGFTDGYLTGRRDLSMFGRRTKEDVTAAAGVLGDLQALYKDERKSVPVSMTFTAKRGEKARLTVSDGAETVTAYGPVPEQARNMPLTAQACEKNLLKLGGTPYFCTQFSAEPEAGLMLPASALNALRREALGLLSDRRAGEEKAFSAAPAPEKKRRTGSDGAVRLRFETAAQLCMAEKAQKLILPLREIESDPSLLAAYGEKLAAELPVLLYPADEARVPDRLSRLKALGLRETVCENIGAVYLTRKAGLTPTGGMHLNILNTCALDVYEDLGVLDNTLSFELDFASAKCLRGAGSVGLIAYGHLPLMRFRACPARGKNGCGDCTGRREIKDRYGEPFPLLCSQKAFSTLYNPIPVYTGNGLLPPMDFYTLYFTIETKQTCMEMTDAFLRRENPEMKKTRGLYDKTLL